ncbi:hypothetical protein F5148DRAFT_1283415 [Russula earlei]|uniref:Uncharacterized protein n=1 Tax=Russula earlei TaxID=71964 RepID=A0ACC0UBX7_9AGAM|nr:hypothetical protein F5148DRAFT_1283415 [Russula earlei]
MALRAIRRSTGNNALDWMVTSAQIASNVSCMLQFPPTMAATTVLLSILQIISDIKANQQDCIRLAQRAARLLVAVGQRMEGKWEEAPQSLLENIREFEAMLLSIRDFMLKAAQAKWISRFVAKASIQDELMQYDQQLRDAAMAFQVSSLIEIHYAMGIMSGCSSKEAPRITDEDVVTSPTEASEVLSSLNVSKSEFSASSFEVVKQSRGSIGSSFALIDADTEALEPESESSPPATPVPTEEEEFLANINGDTDEFGFRRYHQSDVIVRKANRKAVGWFSGTSEAQAGGQKMTIKRYDGMKDHALKQWVRDIKMLRNLHHENLPQILGYSDGMAQTPFILLASVQCRDLASNMRSALTTRSLADCACLILKTYRGIASAIAHAQQQLALSESDAQDFIDHATYSLDSDNNIIVGLPQPRDGWVTARNYGLEESLGDRALQYLQELMNAEEAALQAGSCQSSKTLNKYKQLKGLLHSLLPRRREGPSLSPELEDLLDDVDVDNPPTLHSLRAFCIEQSRHDQTWHSRAPANALAAGDYGYIPGELTDFANFVRLGNIQSDEDCKEKMDVVGRTHGLMLVRPSGNSGFPQRQPATPFLIPDEMESWPVALPPRGNATVFVHHEMELASVNDTWKFLVARGASFASTHGIKPQDLIIVTRSLRIDDYQVEDWRPSLLPPPGIGRANGLTHTPFGAPSFPHRGGFGAGPAFPHHGFGAHDPAVPSIVYLITSTRPDFAAYITDDPMGRPRPRPTRSTSWCFSCRSGSPVGFVDYIQLDAEDVES